ncbi:MAG: MFS transporter [Tessaracoccus sp.]|uniref:MFS transporter n=1 Tax=Tessaracoccus sp. TaxID=1971211 RepID=UPI001EC18BAD|nr:MFS transporter [Tessaracoccus sp.]MBK7822100.1 MFS transporter [Tessaracoccus sp.]
MTSMGGLLRQYGPMVYLPSLVFSVGEGAVIPLIPVIATQRGADIPTAALVASAVVVGTLFGNVPAGWLVGRIGERLTMAIAGAVALLGAVAAVLLPGLAWFTVAVFVTGMAAAAFALARHAFMATRVPLAFRARALSLLGGSTRFGLFIGPFVAAGLLALFGAAGSALWFFAVLMVALIVLVLLGPDPEEQFRTEPAGQVGRGASRGDGVLAALWRERSVLARVGVAGMLLAAVRAARQVVLPLWGVSIGMDASAIALVVGVSGALDFALFYASGQVMDRYGRLWAALPSMLLLSAGFLALSLTHDGAHATTWFAALAGLLGLANGLSSGILMTMGADLAPAGAPAAFLGAWRLLTDTGGALAPVMVAVVAAAASLSLASALVGVLGLIGAAGLLRWGPRYLPHGRQR